MDEFTRQATVEKQLLRQTGNVIDSLLKGTEVKASDFPEMYEQLGIDIKKLGCIMQDVETLDITSHIENGEDDLFLGEDYDDGAVGEKIAHCTLLFGLMENGNKWKFAVDQVLQGWSIDSVTIEKVDAFILKDSICVIGLLEKSDALIEANKRLSLLPHMNTFMDYKPHVTLAYIKPDPGLKDKWVGVLNAVFAGKVLKAKPGLNYGDAER